MMDQARLMTTLERGVLAFPATPFTKEGALDIAALEAHVAAVAAHRPIALVPAGGAGELFSLTAGEHAAIVRATVANAAGVPVIAGIGGGLGVSAEMARNAEKAGADGPLLAFEVILDRIPDAKVRATRARPVLELSAFQPVSRDFAFIVGRSVKAGDIVRAAQSADKKLISGVSVFDLYEGKGIDPDKKSVAIAVTLQPREKTLTDQEIDAVAARIVAEVTKKTGGVLRG